MADRARGEPRYPVRAVIKRTGLSADLLRAWERRYGAVSPERSAGGQRLYTEDDVAKLALLRRATVAGHSIAEVANLGISALEALVDEPVHVSASPPTEAVEGAVAAALTATERLDVAGVEAALKRAALAFGGSALVDHVISRFLERVGERWHSGTLSPAHEHLASSAVRRVLAWTTDAHATSARAPRIVVATASGEHHEFGAMLAAAAAVEEGWRVIYLGANLPGSDVADAARQVGARAVAISAVYANGGAQLEEIRKTARALPEGTTLFVGGQAASAHDDSLGPATRVLPDIPSLRRALRALRVSAKGDQ